MARAAAAAEAAAAARPRFPSLVGVGEVSGSPVVGGLWRVGPREVRLVVENGEGGAPRGRVEQVQFHP